MPKKRVVIFSDFDGTLTGLAGSMFIGAGFGADAEHNFYKSLFIQQANAPFDYSTWKMLETDDLQKHFKKNFGEYDPEKMDFDKGLGKLLMKPDAVAALHILLQQEDVEFNIISRNNKKYIEAVLRYQGFSEKEIGQIKILTGSKTETIRQKLSDEKAAKTEETDIDFYILDDSDEDYEYMANTVHNAYPAPRNDLFDPEEEQIPNAPKTTIHGYIETPGKFDWLSYLKEIFSSLGRTYDTPIHIPKHKKTTAEIVQDDKTILSHLKHPISRADNLQITLADIQNAVKTAKENYIKYHNSSNKNESEFNRGVDKGLFSWGRHGSRGIKNAEKFEHEIAGKTESIEAIDALIKFVQAPSRAYHIHSFASYLGDELAKIKLVQPHERSHYNSKELTEEINQRFPPPPSDSLHN